MPDDNKLDKLRNQGVKPAPCCATCVHFSGEIGWGTCDLASYQHLKHDGERMLPVHATFTCPNHDRDDYVNRAVREVGLYHDLLTEEGGI